MKVFLSHSGDRSKALALDLQKFIRKLVPSADPWISTGIEKGSRWIPEIAETLEAAGVGIVCITSDNLTAPWLLFEAGALSKRLDGKVCTFLLDVEASTVQAPLSQFQHTNAEKDDVLALVEGINKQIEAANEAPRNLEDLREQFETLWPKLAVTIEALRGEHTARPPTRTTDDMVKEVLDIVRGLARQTNTDQTDSRAAILAALKSAGERIAALDVPSSPANPVFATGDSVEHLQFGQGTVEHVERTPDGEDYKVLVSFKGGVGRKVLRLKYARLTKSA